MKNRLSKKLLITLLTCVIFSFSYAQNTTENKKTESVDEMKADFKNPPENVKPWLYWYWINNHISKEGITKDLEAMANVGIGAALIGNIYLDNVPEDGKVPMLSEEWKKLTMHAIREGDRLGVDIGLFNSPGWSQSGGPWNDEQNSMRYLNSSEFQVNGGKRIKMKLTAPSKDFEDVSVMAIPKKTDQHSNNFKLTSGKSLKNLQNLLDKDTATVVDISGQKKFSVLLEAEKSDSFRRLSITPSKSTFMMNVNLMAEVNGNWREIRSFKFDRRSAMDQLGFDDYPPVTVSFPKIEASTFRLDFSEINPGTSKQIGISEIKLSSEPRLEYYIEKQLGKMHQTPLPLDDAYRWPNQPEPNDADFVLAENQVIDISDKLDSDGNLDWEAPKGEWTILRMGMTTTGIKNGPAAPNASGLEVDKINKKALRQHFEGFVGKILNAMPASERKAFKYVVADSYETGSQNWTDDFAKTFQETYDYDPKNFLPVLTGRIVNSVDESNRFLWDLRRLVADKVAYEYVGGLRELSEEHGLQLWLENYGHWGFPSEFLMYGGQSNLISGEFWAEGDLGSIELRAASSAAHIYGKNQVSAESYTAAQKPYLRYPGMLKKRGDWSFTEGINHVVFHVYIQQAYDSVPGVNAWFGTEFNRNNTWFEQSKSWMDYQRRSQFMLQKGRYVADVAYFIGEDTPKMTGVTNPSLPDGFSFDYINAEVIKNRLSVKNGRITLPDGLSYRILVLPDVETMRPELLEKIRDLVNQGAVIMGKPPKSSPSLEDYGEADKKVQQLAKEIWGNAYNGSKKKVSYGKGKVIFPMELDKALEELGSVPDMKLADETPVLWIHRKMDDKEIYFLTNQSDETISFKPSFRIKGMQPEFWDATTGLTRVLPEFSENGNYTQIPLKLEPAQSAFIVFSDKGLGAEKNMKSLQNYAESEVLKIIDNGWIIHFENDKIDVDKKMKMDSLQDWKELDDELKYFSGTASYKTNFDLKEMSGSKKTFLDIGKANVIATVRLNGKEVGGLWTAPWRIEVTDFLKKGKNELEIEVTNLWVNQLIGDDKKPKNEKKTWSLLETYNENDELQPSGLVGPVKLVSFGEVYGQK